MNPKNLKLSFPVWQFLQQPIGDPQRPLVLHPRRFWRKYQFRHLERCWYMDYRPEKRFRS